MVQQSGPTKSKANSLELVCGVGGVVRAHAWDLALYHGTMVARRHFWLDAFIVSRTQVAVFFSKSRGLCAGATRNGMHAAALGAAPTALGDAAALGATTAAAAAAAAVGATAVALCVTVCPCKDRCSRRHKQFFELFTTFFVFPHIMFRPRRGNIWTPNFGVLPYQAKIRDPDSSSNRDRCSVALELVRVPVCLSLASLKRTW